LGGAPKVSKFEENMPEEL